MQPWRPPSLPSAAPALERPVVEAGDEWKLIKALKEAQTQGASLPSNVAELLSKVEDAAGKQVTRCLHSQTKQLGQARQQLQQLRQARAEQVKSWHEYVSASLKALDKGTAAHEERLTRLQDVESQAAEKVKQAQRAIQELSRDAVETISDPDSDEDLPPQDLLDDSQVLQVQKKLRMTLEQLKNNMPASEPASTPKRRGKDGGKDGAGMGDGQGTVQGADGGASLSAALPPPS